jgi:hypothetical protein
VVTFILGIIIGVIIGLAASAYILGGEQTTARKQNRVAEDNGLRSDQRALSRQEHIDRLKQMAVSAARPVTKPKR